MKTIIIAALVALTLASPAAAADKFTVTVYDVQTETAIRQENLPALRGTNSKTTEECHSVPFSTTVSCEATTTPGLPGTPGVSYTHTVITEVHMVLVGSDGLTYHTECYSHVSRWDRSYVECPYSVAGRTFEAKLDKHGKWIEIHTHTAGDIKLDIAQPELTPNVPTQAVR